MSTPSCLPAMPASVSEALVAPYPYPADGRIDLMIPGNAFGSGSVPVDVLAQERRLQEALDSALVHLKLDDLLHALLAAIRDVQAVDSVVVFLLAEDRTSLVVRAATGLAGPVDRAAHVPVGVGLAGRVAAERRPIIVDEPDHVELVHPMPAEHGIRSVLGLPLLVRDRLIGVLHVGSRRARGFTPADVQLLERTAQRAALAIEHSLLYEVERTARAAAETAQRGTAYLAEVSALLAGQLDYPTTLSSMARLSVAVLADWCTIDMVEHGSSLHRLVVAANEPSRERLLRTLGRRYPSSLDGPHPEAVAIRTGQTVFTAQVDPSDHSHLAHDREHRRLLAALGTRSRITVPLVADGQSLGAISFGVVGRFYGDQDVALAEQVTLRAAAAIATARLVHEAQLALRVRDELLSTITHDLAQPLASIRTLAYVIQEEGRSVLAERIDAMALKMTMLCREILDLARMGAGQPLDLHHRAIDLVALVQQQLQMQTQFGKAHQIRVQADVPEIIGTWDRFRLERVVNNLLSNAVKYSPDGGEIDVRLSVATNGDTHDGNEAAAWAVLSVRDQGIGIPAHELPHIFERFYRAKNAAECANGNGLGLWGSRRIVEQHGGTMTIASQEGDGATVTVRLPIR